jgi:hypothetical protein
VFNGQAHEELPMRDADFLVDEFDRVDCGVETTIAIERPECFATREVEVRLRSAREKHRARLAHREGV